PLPANLPAARDGPSLQDVRHERAEVRRVGEDSLEALAVRLARELQDLAAGLVDLDDATLGIDGKQPRRQVARQRARGRLEVVGAPLLAEREPLELALLPVERGDRALEAGDQEIALVARLGAGRGRSAGRREQPVVGR